MITVRIAEVSDRNLRLALLMCETCKIDQYPFTEDQQILEPDWKVRFYTYFIKKIIKSI